MGNGPKRYFFVIACTAAASLGTSTALAYTIPAFDQASSPAYSGGWLTTSPTNGGHGFQPWTFDQGMTNPATGNPFYAPYTSAVIASDSTIGSGASSNVWQLNADGTIAGEPGGTVGISAGRQFDAPMGTGETFFMNMNVESTDTGLSSESLILGSAPTDPTDFTTSYPAFGVLSDSGTGDYDLVDGAGDYAPTSIPVNNDPIHIAFTLTSPDTYFATVTPIDDPSASATLSGALLAPVQFLYLGTTVITGSDGKVSADFNPMGVAPLPPAALAAVPLLGILALKKFKRA